MTSRRLVDLECKTIIIDAGAEGKNSDVVLQQLKNFSPQAIVLSVATPTVDSDLGWFLPLLKSEMPNIPILAVGIHVTALAKESLQIYSGLDFVILGEPEIIVGDLLSKKLEDRDLSQILGIAYRDLDGSIKVNGVRELTDDLDSLGIPDWEKIDFSNYIMPIKGTAFSLVHFARGCPHRCSYCTAHTYNGRSFRKRSVESLMQEIEFNISLGVKDFLFWTELLTGDVKYLNSVLDTIIERKLHEKIRWVCNSRVDTVSLDILKRMKEAGCWQIAFGFDFGSDRMLKLTKKGGRANVELAKKAAAMASEAGLAVDGHFMLGYPGETEVEMIQTINLALSMPLTFSHFYAVVPYPGSQLYSDWIKLKKDQVLPNWDQFDQTQAVIETAELTTEKIKSYKKSAYRRFYLRPSLILRIAKLPKSIYELSNLTRASLHLVKSLLF